MIRVSIVTVTYNAADCIVNTIESVLKQGYSSIEYWIVDGGSCDKTISIAEQYYDRFRDNKIGYNIVSQKDNGIFDAMNKSIDLINGEFVLFLNAGDFLADENVLSSVFDREEVGLYDIVYGDYYAYSKGYRRKYISGRSEDLPNRMICTHQAIFTKTMLLRKRKYDTKYTMTADYDFYLEMYLCKKTFKKVDIPIVYFDINGVSQKKAKITQLERLTLLKKHGCINEKEFEKLKRKIFIVCLKKRIAACLPSYIRFYKYEKIDGV